MEILALVVAGVAIFFCISLGSDIKKLEEKTDCKWDEFDRAIRQLQEISLNPTDRATLDRLNEAAWKAERYDPHHP